MSTIGKPDMNRPVIDRRFVGIDRYTFLSGYPEAADPVTGEVTTQKTTQEKILAQLKISPHLTRRRNMESWGQGIERISRKCLAHGIDAPIYDYSLSGLMLTFRANPQHLPDALGYQDARCILGEKVGETLTQNQRRILSLLRQNARLSARELALDVGISSRRVEQNIARLKALGLLQRFGPAKGGHWKVLE